MRFNRLKATEPLRGDSLLLPLTPQEFLVLISSILEGWKDEFTLKPPCGFKPGTPRLEIQCPNHYNNW